MTQYGLKLLHQTVFPCDLIALMFGIHRAVLRADPRIRSGLRMAPCCQSVSPRHYPPPTSPWWGALRAKVQELAPAPVQTTDQWARSRIDRATWVPEVPANPAVYQPRWLLGSLLWYRPLFSRPAYTQGHTLTHTFLLAWQALPQTQQSHTPGPASLIILPFPLERGVNCIILGVALFELAVTWWL